MVFQHVPYEPLGTLDPLVRSQRHRIRYINFGRNPDAKPDIDGYDALIILGGPMNIGQENDYPHLITEKDVIKQAMKLDIPILGICLGAQLIASSLGAKVTKAAKKEIGWYNMAATNEGKKDPLMSVFNPQEKIFQWHEYTFSLPKDSKLIVKGEQLANQAFRVNKNVYAFQFHLEASLALVKRWLELPQHLQELGLDKAKERVETIWEQTLENMPRSLILSEQVFSQFLKLLPKVKETHTFSHKH